jgi:hypothetical protein
VGPSESNGASRNHLEKKSIRFGSEPVDGDNDNKESIRILSALSMTFGGGLAGGTSRTTAAGEGIDCGERAGFSITGDGWPASLQLIAERQASSTTAPWNFPRDTIVGVFILPFYLNIMVNK